MAISKIERLRQAGELIASVVDELDLSVNTCESCGSGVFVHKADARAYERLFDLPKKLRNIAQELDPK